MRELIDADRPKPQGEPPSENVIGVVKPFHTPDRPVKNFRGNPGGDDPQSSQWGAEGIGDDPHPTKTQRVTALTEKRDAGSRQGIFSHTPPQIVKKFPEVCDDCSMSECPTHFRVCGCPCHEEVK